MPSSVIYTSKVGLDIRCTFRQAFGQASLGTMALLKSLFPVLFTAALVEFAITDPATTSGDGNSILYQAANLTLLNSVPKINDHGRFSLRVYLMNTRLNSISMMMNALDALAIISVENQVDRSLGLHFHLPSHPSVRIDVVPDYPARDVLNEVATLCIYYGMADMLKNRRFTEVALGCVWDGVEVAIVSITRATSSTTNVIPNTIVTADDSSSNTLQPSFFYIPDAATLDITVAFMTLMDALVRFSRVSKTDIVGQS